MQRGHFLSSDNGFGVARIAKFGLERSGKVRDRVRIVAGEIVKGRDS